MQSTGHADLVQHADGRWALVYLGTRPRGSSPGWHVAGRETFASEIEWEHGWPRIGDPIQPGPSPAMTETLTGGDLPMSWVAAASFADRMLVPAEGGWRLSSPDTAFAGRRQEHLYFRAEAGLVRRFGLGGLQLRIDARHAVTVELADGVARAVAQVGSIRSVLGETTAGSEVVAEIRTEPAKGSAFSTERGPDEIVAGLVTREGFNELGRVDGRYVSTEVAGGMTGRMVGLFCQGGELLLRSFSYRGDDTAATDAGPAPSGA